MCIILKKCKNHQITPKIQTKTNTDSDTDKDLEETECAYTKKECLICCDDKQEAFTHTCEQCSKNSWFICRKCQTELKGKPCPMCRKINPEDEVTVNVRDEVEDISMSGITSYRHTCFSHCRQRCQVSYRFISYLLRVVACFILFQYLGKIYYWIYCTATCGEKPSSCICGGSVKRDGYWSDFSNYFPETCGGLIVSGMIVGCCFRLSQDN